MLYLKLNIKYFLIVRLLLFALLYFFISIVVSNYQLHASDVVIKGRVTDFNTKKPIDNVSIINIYTNAGLSTDSTGLFHVKVKKGELIEFQKLGYKIARVRISGSLLPDFYNIELHKGAIDIAGVDIIEKRVPNWKTDSVKNYEQYKNVLEYFNLDGLQAIQSPFEALSKRNRQIWAFQKNYKQWEQEKFIDYVFNEKTIIRLTNLGEDSIYSYKFHFRPTYKIMKNLSEYEFYEYIKQTVFEYRRKSSIYFHKNK